jgi:hypothetical protein
MLHLLSAPGIYLPRYKDELPDVDDWDDLLLQPCIKQDRVKQLFHVTKYRSEMATALLERLYDTPRQKRAIVFEHPNTRHGGIKRRRDMEMRSAFTPIEKKCILLQVDGLVSDVLPFASELDVGVLAVENHWRCHDYILRHRHCARCAPSFTCDEHSFNDIVVFDLPLDQWNLFKPVMYMLRFSGLSKVRSTWKMLRKYQNLQVPAPGKNVFSFKLYFVALVRVLRRLTSDLPVLDMVDRLLQCYRDGIKDLVAEEASLISDRDPTYLKTVNTFVKFFDTEDPFLRYVNVDGFEWRNGAICKVN